MKWMLTCLGLFLISPLAVQGAIVRAHIDGVVDRIDTGGAMTLDGSVSEGAIISGCFVYDCSSPPINYSDYGAEYPVASAVINIGNYDFLDNPADGASAVFKVFMGNRVYAVSTEPPAFEGQVYVAGAAKEWSEVQWHWGHMEVMNLWTSSAEYWQAPVLPDASNFPPLEAFNLRKDFEVRMYGEGDDYFGIYGHITELTIVPEPGTVILLGIGGVLLRRMGGYRK